MRDSDESVALNFLREDSALGVDERGRSEWWDAADNGRLGVNGIGRDGLGVDVGAMLRCRRCRTFQIRFRTDANRSCDSKLARGRFGLSISQGPPNIRSEVSYRRVPNSVVAKAPIFDVLHHTILPKMIKWRAVFGDKIT